MDPLKSWNQSRWNQLNEPENLRCDLGRLSNRFRAYSPGQHLKAPQWIPLVNVSENAHRYAIKAELRQVKQENVKITLEENLLTISGDLKFEHDMREDQHVAQASGYFAHSFVIPADARPAKLSTEFKNGVLIVHLARNHARRQAEGESALAGAVRETTEPRPANVGYQVE